MIAITEVSKKEAQVKLYMCSVTVKCSVLRDAQVQSKARFPLFELTARVDW